MKAKIYKTLLIHALAAELWEILKEEFGDKNPIAVTGFDGKVLRFHLSMSSVKIPDEFKMPKEQAKQLHREAIKEWAKEL